MAGQDYAQLKKLAEAAAQGEWSTECFDSPLGDTGDYSHCDRINAEKHILLDVWDREGSCADVAYIAAANPSTILALLARLEKAEAPAKWAMPEEVAEISATLNTLLEVSGRKPFSPIELKSALPILTHVVTSELRRLETCLRSLRGAAQAVYELSQNAALYGFDEIEMEQFATLAAALAGAPGDSGSEKKEK